MSSETHHAEREKIETSEIPHPLTNSRSPKLGEYPVVTGLSRTQSLVRPEWGSALSRVLNECEDHRAVRAGMNSGLRRGSQARRNAPQDRL